jgi:hypothetical protein
MAPGSYQSGRRSAAGAGRLKPWHASLDNYIAMISGQAATPQTRNDCQTYAEFALTGVTPDGQAIGSGCVYPASIKTIADQLTARGRTWRAYMGDSVQHRCG